MTLNFLILTISLLKELKTDILIEDNASFKEKHILYMYTSLLRVVKLNQDMPCLSNNIILLIHISAI